MGQSLGRRQFISGGSAALAGTIAGLGPTAAEAAQSGAAQPHGPSRPNIVVILLDDLGFGDFGCYGSPLIRTPHVDRLAHEGVRFTQGYAGAPTCTPSRAALLTGRVPTRVGLPHVLFPQAEAGLPDEERTIAEYVQEVGYRTACIGKWHLGARPEHNPTRHGFETFFGLLYSNDMSPLALWRNNEVVDETVDQSSLTRRYTEEAISFIDDAGDDPFLLYLAHSMPHIPFSTEPAFTGVSEAGPYGDVVEAIDHYVGDLLDALRERDLDRETLVILSSDNGPWFEGCTGGLRGRKAGAYEGGTRVPFVARWLGVTRRNHESDIPVSFLDVLPTVCEYVGVRPDPDVTLDGVSIREALEGAKSMPHTPIYYYLASGTLAAIRDDRWKLHVHRLGGDQRELPQLFDLVRDPQECYDLGERHPSTVERLSTAIKEFDAGVRWERGERVLEAETLLPAASSTAPAVRQTNCCGVTWSEGAQMWLRGEQPGASATLEFFLPEGGRYAVSAVLTKSWSYGFVEFAIDGQPVGEPFNGYSDRVEITTPVPFGVMGLDAGQHTLRLTVPTKDDRANNYHAGVDLIQFGSS